MRCRVFAVVAALWALALASGDARADASTLTVEQAVEMALHGNPRLLAAESNVQGDRDLERSAGARLFPAVHVTDEYDHWDSDFVINFGTPLTVRNQNTNTFAATAEQPLLGLWRLSHERDAQGRTADATEAHRAALAADVKATVEVGFLRLFEARALEDVARASEAELKEEAQVTKAKVDAGVLTNADLLRVEVAVANAKEQGIVAHSQGEVARAELLGVIGLPMGAPGIDFAEPTALLARARAALPRTDDAQKQAVALRPEVRERRFQMEAAGHQYSARKLAMLPEINAEAGYNHLDGQIFSPQNSGSVGVKLSWPIFEWGASFYAQRAAGAARTAAEHELDGERNQVAVEVASDLSRAQAAGSAVDVAQQTIASAQEAFRVTGALLKAGSATTTDLLDSQAALTQARLNLTRAQYAQAIAQANLERTMGR